MKTNDRYVLTPEDAQELRDLLDCGIDTTDKRGHVLSALKTLRAREAAGGKSAGRILDTMACNGLYQALSRHAARDTGVFLHAETGRVLNVPQRGSIRAKSESGSPTGARQLKYWKEMTVAEFGEWAASQIHLAQALEFKAVGINLVLAAIEQVPDAKNAGDACRLAGIDPDALELDRTA